MVSDWFPHINQVVSGVVSEWSPVVSGWSPSGIRMLSTTQIRWSPMWSPSGLRVVSKWSPDASATQIRWSPMWSLGGFRVVSGWSLGGLRWSPIVVSEWFPNGLQVVSGRSRVCLKSSIELLFGIHNLAIPNLDRYAFVGNLLWCLLSYRFLVVIYNQWFLFARIPLVLNCLKISV